jgi:hypothetical protein
VPGVKKQLGVALTLTDGETTFTTWSHGKGKLLSITPAQTTAKAFQSKKAITLYAGAPLTGEAIDLNLITPPGVQLGAVCINQASVAAMKFNSTLPNNGFELQQSGANQWTIYFKGGKAPEAAKGKLKASYTLKLELWAEGTYKDENNDGIPEPLTEGTKKSKPTLVSVKVNIK